MWKHRSDILSPLTNMTSKHIKDVAVPSNKNKLRSFIGEIHYYRDMWKHRSDILSPLTNMTNIIRRDKSCANYIAC